MKTRHVSKAYALLGASVSLVLIACSSNAPIPELEAAQASVAQIEASPLRNHAAANLNAARNALTRAERAAEGGHDVEQVKHLASLAQLNAEIASEKIQTAQARETIDAGEAARQRVLAQARARELALTQQQLLQARSAAQLAAKQRNQLELQLQELQELNARRTERGIVLTLGDLLFSVDEATIKPGAMHTLDELSQFLKAHDDRTVLIEGHTDSTGAAAYNIGLSRERAYAVSAALQARGIASDRIHAVGKGEAFPVASNANVGGRQENRRVEIVLPEIREQLSSDRT